jgi:hypothetical protein
MFQPQGGQTVRIAALLARHVTEQIRFSVPCNLKNLFLMMEQMMQHDHVSGMRARHRHSFAA